MNSDPTYAPIARIAFAAQHNHTPLANYAALSGEAKRAGGLLARTYLPATAMPQPAWPAT